MPIIKTKYQKPPKFYGDAHGNTLIPGALRKIKGVTYERERLELPDGDFLDLDWVDNNGDQLVILTHGLEGDSDRQYIRGTAKYFAQRKWDVLAWNCRSCSGEINRNPRLYYHGEIGDIESVLLHALSTKDYRQVVLIGFSMGGNINMKYCGVHGNSIPDPITHCISFSAPCDLGASADTLNRPGNWFYRKRFLKMLREKIIAKTAQYPDFADLSNFDQIEKWQDFDRLFSTPINKFDSLEAFYADASAMNFMLGITVPTLLVNAQNDPILTPSCSPVHLADKNPNLYFEIPRYGGHCGFPIYGSEFNYSEMRAWEFANGI